ncbi:MAG: GNAT family N-acetyltransferase [Selenomonas sp.]|uniref:GNAT family N-acetyltransferase n=1 Tax=Selenomonas sp. TaxID=2053611 RepID=UPI0025FF9D3D|nr:GNAT family N-acetyltransferase [Selenomonas sp.]MCR5757674.1 GNAT family N-acetyltransferase [Selenomonas sp.]
MSEITIRTAAPEDAAAILDIYRYYIQKTAITFEITVPSAAEFQARITAILKQYPYLVSIRNNTIVGYAYAREFVGREAYNHSVELTIYLSPAEKGRGTGRKLYAALEQKLAAQGILNLYACIADPPVEDEYLNHNSENFHAHLGFTKVGTFHKCGRKFNRWYNMIWMEKLLGPHPDSPLH